jgi:membrane associated rhomboid family serine protease/cell division septum initiation protein DivIVA
MIIPIGHGESEVRRWPWVSFAIMAICLLALLATNGDANDPRWELEARTLEDAATYWRERPYLEPSAEVEAEVGYDVAPNQRRQYLAVMRDQAQDSAPEDPEELAAEQAELDELTHAALEGGGAVPAEHPYRKWGFTPGDPSVVTLVTHVFMHAGWIHLLSNLFLFFLAGPALEDRWGRPLFGAFFLGAGVFSGLFFALMSQDGSLPLVGASGAISGALGAFLVRFMRTQIRFAYFWFIGFRVLSGTFEAPAWLMLPLWFANELLQAWLGDALGATGGVAYWAHVGGFVSGVGAALAVQSTKLEERFVHAAIEAKVTLARGNPVVEEAARLRAAGDLEGAFALLEAESRKKPDDPDVGVGFWDAAVALQRPEAAAPALARAIRRLSAGESLPSALAYWTELVGLVPSALVDPTTLLRFVPVLRKESRHAEASRALRDAASPENRVLGTAQALRIAELARESDPAVALAAARRALEAPDLPAPTRARLEQQLGTLEGAAAEAKPVPEPKRVTAPQPAEPAAAADRSIELEADPAYDVPLSVPAEAAGPALAARFSDVKAADAAPSALDETTLALVLPGGRAARLELAKVQAIAVGTVGGLGPKPVILVDLLLNHDEVGEGPLRLVRLRSDRFDPRRLAAGATALDAFHAFLNELATRTNAALLPDPESFRGGAFSKYADLDAWQREVLKVG